MKKVPLPTLYSQWDNRWASEPLGYNTAPTVFDIDNYGCTISCHAMILEYLGYDHTPKTVNELFKEKNGFARGGGLYIWGSMKRLFDKVLEEKITRTPNDPLTDEQMDEIKTALDAHYPVLLQIDVDPSTVKNDMHYVLAIGYNPDDENDILIADPLGGIERSLKKYLGFFKPSARTSITQYIVYTSKLLKKSDMQNEIIDFDDHEGNRHSVGWYDYEWFNEKTKSLQKDKEHEIEQHKKDVFVKGVMDANETISAENKRKEHKIQSLLKETSNQKIQIAQLKSHNASMMDVGTLLALIVTKVMEKLQGLLDRKSEGVE